MNESFVLSFLTFMFFHALWIFIAKICPLCNQHHQHYEHPVLLHFRFVSGSIFFGWQLPHLFVGQSRHLVEQSGIPGDIFIDVFYGLHKTSTWLWCWWETGDKKWVHWGRQLKTEEGKKSLYDEVEQRQKKFPKGENITWLSSHLMARLFLMVIKRTWGVFFLLCEQLNALVPFLYSIIMLFISYGSPVSRWGRLVQCFRWLRVESRFGLCLMKSCFNDVLLYFSIMNSQDRTITFHDLHCSK